MLTKKYNFQEREGYWQRFWEENEVYRFHPSSERELFSIDTPPPTVSGSLHIGHVFSYTQAEMIARFQRMQGKNVFYPFGFDDNGLPTERLVEKEQGITGSSIGRSDFSELCLMSTAKHEEKFRKLWNSLGLSVDWQLQYQTISPEVQRISQQSFLDLVRTGKAYMKETPVLWCTTCQTSIAQAELEFAEAETTFNHLRFLVEGEEVILATTRPELLFGCVAILVHPADGRYRHLAGKQATVPLYGFSVPVFTDSRVSPEKGTGIVMCCTFGDATDLEWYQELELPYKRVIEADGTINSAIPFIGGLPVKQGRHQIIQDLNKEGLIAKSEEVLHSVGRHERCGQDVEIIPSQQWFVAILDSKQQFLEAADQINWYPAYMKKRYVNWVENLKWDWCISRQRFFGVPFPLWYCAECGEATFARPEQLPVNPLEQMPEKACSCGCQEFVPEEAVFDTWATSSLTPLINAHTKGEERTFLPMSMRTQAHEIIRTWAFYTIVKSIYHTGKIPWKDIMLCGFVLAKKGEKMSKSKGNANYEPHEIIEEHSADAIRYWAASAKLGTDTTFSLDELAASKRFLTKIWNAGRFTLMHLEDYHPQAAEGKLLPIDKWIMQKLTCTLNEVASSLNRYEVGVARQLLDAFFWNDYCDNYLEIVKERLYQPEKHGELERRGAQQTLYQVFLGIMKAYAIFVPHITEEIYQSFFRQFEQEVSLHNSTWETELCIDPEIGEFGEFVERLLAEVRKYKSEYGLSLKTELDMVRVTLPEKLHGLLQENLKDLQACTGARSISITAGEEIDIAI